MCNQVTVNQDGKSVGLDRELVPLLHELQVHGVETTESCYWYEPGVAMLTIASPEAAFRFLAAADVQGREAAAKLICRLRAGCITTSRELNAWVDGIGNGRWEVMPMVMEGEGESLGLMSDEDLPYIPLMDAVTIWVSIRMPQGDVPIVLGRIQGRLTGVTNR
jgi:hypothetical protein